MRGGLEAQPASGALFCLLGRSRSWDAPTRGASYGEIGSRARGAVASASVSDPVSVVSGDARGWSTGRKEGLSGNRTGLRRADGFRIGTWR